MGLPSGVWLTILIMMPESFAYQNLDWPAFGAYCLGVISST